VEYRAYEQNQIFDFINNGYLAFSGDATNAGLVPVLPGLENSPAVNDFANGFVSNFYDQSNSNRQGYRDKFFSVFAQDDFKLARNFTLNLGLRWDYAAPLSEIRNRVSTFRPGQQSTIFPTAPAGLVFPGDKGIGNSTYSPDYKNFGPRVGFAWDPTGQGKISIRSGFGLFYNVAESELTLQYLGAAPYGAQVVAIGSTDMTHPYQTSVSPLAQNPFPFQTAKPGDKFDFTNVAPVGITLMDPKFKTPSAMQYDFEIQYQIAKDWLASVAYVGSQGRHLLDRRNINPAIVTPDASRGNEDSRRVFNQNNPLNDAFGGAVFGGITDQLSDSTSSYNSLQMRLDKRFSGDPRANQFGLPNSYFNGTGGGTSSAATNPFFHRVGTGASVAAGAGRYGNLGRNVFHGPGTINDDFSISKITNLTERQKLIFRAEAFNLFNHTNFFNPNTGIDSPTFGTVTLAHDPRLIQLRLQYTF
jgi:TonB dependent receptor